ncbi:MAG: L,D-transpeptidase family protein [Thermodesulfobacteriota bacterium]
MTAAKGVGAASLAKASSLRYFGMLCPEKTCPMPLRPLSHRSPALPLSLVCLLAFGLLAAKSAAKTAPLPAEPASPAPVEAAVSRLVQPLVGDGSIRFVLIEKDRQRLRLLERNGEVVVLASYSCATGQNQGPKAVSGDARTPEGVYFVTRSFEDSKITVFGRRAFHLDYPNVFDQAAQRNGDGIYIHGTNRELAPNSTNGCITLRNQDLDELAGFLEPNAIPVVIVDSLDRLAAPGSFALSQEEIASLAAQAQPGAASSGPLALEALYLVAAGSQAIAVSGFAKPGDADSRFFGRLYLDRPAGGGIRVHNRVEPTAVELAQTSRGNGKTEAEAAAYPRDQERLLAFVERWRRSWEGKKLHDYIACYAPEFRSQGMNVAAWKRYKGRLNQQYKTIRVQLTDRRVEWTATGARVSFLQSYRSDRFQARGKKTLVLTFTGSDWQIRQELWHGGR